MRHDHAPRPRPVAHVTVPDAACRAAILRELGELGWTVHDHPSGAHLVAAISGLILGDGGDPPPDLIVADERARGCTGASLAGALRELGLLIPTVLVTDGDGGLGGARAAAAVTADRAGAPRVVGAYARALAPPREPRVIDAGRRVPPAVVERPPDGQRA